MAMTPVELRHVQLHKRLFGYASGAVDRVLEETVESFEDVWRHRADLADRVEQLEQDLVRYRELETLLRTTLVTAERAAHELKDAAKREAELIVAEAHAEARRVTHAAVAERERLVGEATRVRAQLAAALQTLGEEPEPDVAGRRRAA